MTPSPSGASPAGARRGRGRPVAVALALAALTVFVAAGVFVRAEVAALWYEHRLDHGPEAERADAMRRLAATRTDRGLRRVLEVLLEEPEERDRPGTRAPTIPIKGLIAVPEEAAASRALAEVGPALLPVATAVIAEVVARGDAGELNRAARRLGPLVIPLGHLDDWAAPVTRPWIEGLKLGHGRARAAAAKLQDLGVAALPGLLGVLESADWTLSTWSESILWQMAQKSEPACRGLLHAHARADARRKLELARVLESAGEDCRIVLESVLAGRDPTLSRAAREVLEEIAAAGREPPAR
jgi:hypothetical protein